MSAGIPSADSNEEQASVTNDSVSESQPAAETVGTDGANAPVQQADSTSVPQPAASVETPAAPAAVPTDPVAAEPAPVEPAPAVPEEAPVESAAVTEPPTASDAGSGAAEAIAAAATSVAGAATAAAAADDGTPKRKVKLDPTIKADHLRPVGSSDPVDHGTSSGTSDAPIPQQSTGPVEIPRIDDLGDDLEAQLTAAMSNEAVAAEATADAPAVPTEEGDGEDGLEPGTRIKGTVVQIHADNVFLDAGLRSNAVVPLRQFESGKHPSVGDAMEVTVVAVNDEEGIIEASLLTGTRKIKNGWEDVAVGQIVDCMVSKSNKGGLEVAVSTLRGFLPSSQIELGFCNDLDSFVGQKLQVQITEVNPRKRNLVVSRRKLLQAERAEAEKGFWEAVDIGQKFTGRVKTIKNYGAFIDIGAVDGFLHIGEISWSHVNHPNEILKEGQTVDVQVLTVDPEKRRVGLGMRQLTQDPWATASERYVDGTTAEGKVTRVTAFGAFVQLERGIEGLVHISQLAWRRVGSVKEVLNVGDTRDFQILEVDTIKKKISLSVKALEAKPESARKDEPEDTPAPVRKKRTGPLRGGTGPKNGGGGLFGNPTDFGT